MQKKIKNSQGQENLLSESIKISWMNKMLSVLKEVLCHCNDAVVLLDKSLIIQYANPKFLKCIDSKNKTLAGHTFSLLKNELNEKDLKKLDNDRVLKINLPNKKNTDLHTINLFKIEPIKPLNAHYAGIIEKTCSKEDGGLSRVEKKDPVTGLLNRFGLEEVMGTIIELCNYKKLFFSILYIDIDSFNYINQLLGFKKGDLLLGQIAERFIKITKKHFWLGRLFGDKFLCISHLTPQKAKKQYLTITKAFFNTLKNPFCIDNKNYYLTVSIGIVSFPEGGGNSDQLIQNGQIALEHAKLKTGNSSVHFNEKLSHQTKKTLEIDAQLKKMDMDKELKIVYQPQIEAKTGKVIGAEALIRWHHQSLGVLSPKDFCPIATKNGLIIDISRWVIENIAKSIQQWEITHTPIVPIAINIPTIGFYQRDFISNLKKIINKHKIRPKNLQLEVTENLMLRNVPSVIAELKELDRLGFKVILDDFGTGFSNLSYLSQFKLYALKIDMSFVKQMNRSWHDKALIKIIIQTAKNFNLLVIAEGAETLKQVQQLKKLDCGIIQGYYFSKPIDEERFIKFLIKHKTKNLL